jgi:hypothetical protein
MIVFSASQVNKLELRCSFVQFLQAVDKLRDSCQRYVDDIVGITDVCNLARNRSTTYSGLGETRRSKNRLAITIAARAYLPDIGDLQLDWIASVAGDVVLPSVRASTSP